MITVVGSINMDLVVRSPRFPEQGETILGDLYTTAPGGKGANQAVAAARLGSGVRMVGAVGTDLFGDELLETLKQEGIDAEAVTRQEGTSGIANILLSEGDNRIIVVPGANHKIDESLADRMASVLAESEAVVTQLELPFPLVRRTLEICREHGVPSILNPAPAAAEAKGLLELAAYITPNETEAAALFGAEWLRALERYPNRLIVTQGKRGACFHDGKRIVEVPGFPAEAVDTTGAGDTFNGALAAAFAEGTDLAEAVRFANAAASLAVEKLGAQSGMPSRQAVAARMAGEED
ncbi:ribokinase [Indiicoccus explosivorum]|uniref:ribokinase n=1 Tax=Indiicoccus explosivorum TaxID=1917864 RepID=UPI000B4538AA|nr:ribokinase [Indiicoccus explosivorum]